MPQLAQQGTGGASAAARAVARPARAVARRVLLMMTAVGRSKLWENALVQAAVLPLLAVQLKRWFDAAVQAATDRVFTQVRFRDDSELRNYISHKLQNSRAGFRVSTLDEEHGAAEVLRDNNVDLFAYTLRTHGAAPLHATHMPLESASSWLWLAGGDDGAPWWSLPVVWIYPENVESPFWSSLPFFIKSMIESATSTIKRFMTLPADGESAANRASNRLGRAHPLPVRYVIYIHTACVLQEGGVSPIV